MVVGQPLQEETREVPGREGCNRTGSPPLQDRLGVPAQCPHPAAGGRHTRAEDRARLALLWAGGVRGHWPLGRQGRAVRDWGMRCTYSCLHCSLDLGIWQWGLTQAPPSLPSARVLGALVSPHLHPRTCLCSRLHTLWRWSWTLQPLSTLSTPDLDITIYS